MPDDSAKRMAQRVIAYKNEVEAPEAGYDGPGVDTDANGNVVTVGQVQAPDALTRLPDRMTYEAERLAPELSQVDRDRILDATIAAKVAADRIGREQLQKTVNQLSKLPGGMAGAMAGLKVGTAIKQGIQNYADEHIQHVRQPVMMQREFSNDQEKQAYLERLREAMKNAAKK